MEKNTLINLQILPTRQKRETEQHRETERATWWQERHTDTLSLPLGARDVSSASAVTSDVQYSGSMTSPTGQHHGRRSAARFISGTTQTNPVIERVGWKKLFEERDFILTFYHLSGQKNKKNKTKKKKRFQYLVMKINASDWCERWMGKQVNRLADWETETENE